MGVDDERHRELKAPLLAAGELGGPSPGQVAQAQLGEHGFGGGRCPAGADRPPGDQLADGEGAREAGLLVHDAEAPAGGRPAGVGAVDADHARGRHERPGERADERRLACTVRPEQREALAGPEGQVDAAQRVRPVVAVLQSSDRHDVSHVISLSNGDDSTVAVRAARA